MTVVLPLAAAPAGQAVTAPRSHLASLGWLKAAGHGLAALLGALHTYMKGASEPRLTPDMKRDIGLLPDQDISGSANSGMLLKPDLDAPVWGPSGIVWRS